MAIQTKTATTKKDNTGNNTGVIVAVAAAGAAGLGALIYFATRDNEPVAPTAVFSPASGKVGSIITVTGAHWSTSESISAVAVGGTSAVFVISVNAEGKLSGTITVPAISAGPKSISITGSKTGMKMFSNVFTVTVAPPVDSWVNIATFSAPISLSAVAYWTNIAAFSVPITIKTVAYWSELQSFAALISLKEIAYWTNIADFSALVSIKEIANWSPLYTFNLPISIKEVSNWSNIASFNAPISLKVPQGILALSYFPSNAVFLVSSTTYGTTQLTPGSWYLGPGTYQWSCELNGYQSRSGSFTIVSGQTLNWTISLTPNINTLRWIVGDVINIAGTIYTIHEVDNLNMRYMAQKGVYPHDRFPGDWIPSPTADLQSTVYITNVYPAGGFGLSYYFESYVNGIRYEAFLNRGLPGAYQYYLLISPDGSTKMWVVASNLNNYSTYGWTPATYEQWTPYIG